MPNAQYNNNNKNINFNNNNNINNNYERENKVRSSSLINDPRQLTSRPQFTPKINQTNSNIDNNFINNIQNYQQ